MLMVDRSIDRKSVNARYYQRNKKRIAAQRKAKRKAARLANRSNNNGL